MLPEGCDAALFGKLEAFNPGGSVKDRIGVAMIEAAEREGRIEPGRTTDRRGDERQHRHRARVRLRREGLRAGADAPAGHEPRARGAAAALRRARRGDRVDGRDAGGGRGRASDGRARRRLPAGPVLQPRQPGDPPPHDGPRDLGGDGGAGRRAGGGRRHRRHDHRRGGGAEGAQPGPARGGRRAALAPRCSRAAPGSPQDPGDRRRLRARGAQPRRARRGGRGRRRGRDRDRAPARAPRGRAGRDLVRRGDVGGDRGREAARVGAASGSSSCCPTPASATSRRRSSRRSPRGTVVVRRVRRRYPWRHGRPRQRLDRDPPRRARGAGTRPRRARRRLDRDPRVLARRARGARPSRRPRAPHGARAVAAAARRGREPAADGDRDPPRGAHRAGLLHRPRHGRRDRRDGRDRRRRDALPGRHARRHRLRVRQAPPDGRGQRHDRLGREAARARSRSGTARRSAPTRS